MVLTACLSVDAVQLSDAVQGCVCGLLDLVAAQQGVHDEVGVFVVVGAPCRP